MHARGRRPPTVIAASRIQGLIGDLDDLAECKVARQDDVFSPERDDEGARHGPGTYPRNRGELCHELLVWQPAQNVRVQLDAHDLLVEMAALTGESRPTPRISDAVPQTQAADARNCVFMGHVGGQRQWPGCGVRDRAGYRVRPDLPPDG